MSLIFMGSKEAFAEKFGNFSTAKREKAMIINKLTALRSA